MGDVRVTMRVALALRRRRWVLLIAAGVCTALVALPLIGLLRIDDATDDSHQFVGLVTTMARAWPSAAVSLAFSAAARSGAVPVS